jgi:hypothetical protein
MRHGWLGALTVPCAVAASAVILFTALGDALFSMVRLRLSQSRAAETLAWNLAESAAFAAAASPTGRATIGATGGATASARVAPSEAPAFEVVVRGRRNAMRFRCELLAGQAARALGMPLSLRDPRPVPRVDPAPRRLGVDDFPALVPDLTKVAASPAALGPDVAEDPSIGVLRLRAGTERKDWTLRAGQDGIVRLGVPPNGIVLVPGHLWLDRGSGPLVIELARSLTIVVDGNLYLGRSLEVRGPGRLALVARRGEADGFADRDLDGCWSPTDGRLRGEGSSRPNGPLEGSGSIYLGLPGDAAPEPELVAGATLVAEAELHAIARRVLVRGAVVGAHGLTLGPDCDSCTVDGEAVPVISRERIPGFVTTGRPRPGWLQRIE